MNARLLLALLLFAAPQPEQKYFLYERPLQLPVQQRVQQTCAVLDPAFYNHAAPQLADVRLYRGEQETPFVISQDGGTSTAYLQNEPLNLGLRDGKVSFDVKMPAGPYSDVVLNIDPAVQNFVFAVDVSGRSSPDDAALTQLGSYTIFDLTKQTQGRSTSLHLPLSTFAYLHFSITGQLSPEAVKGLRYTTAADGPPKRRVVAKATQAKQSGKDTVYTFDVPKNIPVDNVRFVPSSAEGNFHRQVEIKAEEPGRNSEEAQPAIQNLSILRYRGTEDGKRIDEENLDQQPLAANLSDRSQDTQWTVTILNGDDAPLALDSVELEMTQRQLCFDAAPGAVYTLYYGDAALSAPHYDYAGFFHREKDAAQAVLGPEQANPQFSARPDDRPFTEKHPSLLWGALLLVVLVLGGVAFRSAKQVAPER